MMENSKHFDGDDDGDDDGDVGETVAKSWWVGHEPQSCGQQSPRHPGR